MPFLAITTIIQFVTHIFGFPHLFVTLRTISTATYATSSFNISIVATLSDAVWTSLWFSLVLSLFLLWISRNYMIYFAHRDAMVILNRQSD